MHTLKYSEFQGGSGLWYCNDTSDLLGAGSKWWTPARMMNIPLDNYVEMLINDFKVDNIEYSKDTNLLLFSWNPDHGGLAHKFVLYINKHARDHKFSC